MLAAQRGGPALQVTEQRLAALEEHAREVDHSVTRRSEDVQLLTLLERPQGPRRLRAAGEAPR